MLDALKVNEHVDCGRPEGCPECDSTRIQIVRRGPYHKTVFDLKFTSSGVRRWLIRYSSQRYRCLICKKSFFADEYRSSNSQYGKDLACWALYHHVALRQSYEDVTLSINEIFGFAFSYVILNRIMPGMAERHAATYERLKEKLRCGTLIHADETKAALKGHTGYVWAFTNLEEVIYAYTPTREGTILGEMLDGFEGVLVSDFYSAYDSAKCAQQKCLIHLARDINDDLFHNPFDEELKGLAQQKCLIHLARDINDDLFHNPFDEELKGLAQAFVAVLKPIVDTIDRFGLKCCHLSKHKQDVQRFYRLVDSADYRSEAAKKYQKRIQKYRSSLFTSLDHDGVPWNNNNAENARA